MLIPPGNETGSKSEALKGSSPPWPPRLVDTEPATEGGSQVVDISFDPDSPHGPFDRGQREPQVLIPPNFESESDLVRFGLTRSAVGPAVSSAPRGSSFHGLMDRVEREASPQLAPRTLYSSPAAQTAAARLREAGQTPSP